MKFSIQILIIVCMLSSLGFAEDFNFSSVPLTRVEKKEEVSIPLGDSKPNYSLKRKAYVSLTSSGEAYLLCETEPTAFVDGLICPNAKLVAKTRLNDPFEGAVVLKDSKDGPTKKFRFKAEKGKSDAVARNDFYAGKKNYYEYFQNVQLPGASWFDKQATQSLSELSGKSSNAASQSFQNVQRAQRASTIDDTYSLFSGGRAVSENLQIDRGLQLGLTGSQTIDISSISGLTVAPFDWKPLVGNLNPSIDPLASLLPADQYSFLFPSFSAVTSLIDEADKSGSALLPYFESRSESVEVRARYQKQLCLPLDEVSKLLGPALIKTVAVTGSDPYFRTGTDVAIIFETDHKEEIAKFIELRHEAEKGKNPNAELINSSFEGISYKGIKTPSRDISSYLAITAQGVVVSNSKVQIEKIIGAQAKKVPTLSSLDEYKFFRDRYKRGEANETALLIVPDAAIRKWGGPVWRIGSSRRTQAAAVLTKVEVDDIYNKVEGVKTSGKIENSYPGLGKIEVSDDVVLSAIYGTQDFLTPISELKIDKISPEESSAYERFKTTYSLYWKTYFDPLAVRFGIRPESRGVDLTVMPLIASTDYGTLRELSQSTLLDEYSGDFHPNILFEFTSAFNSNWKMLTPFAGIGIGRASLPGVDNPVSCVGKSFSIFLDDDPIWKEALTSENKESFFKDRWSDIPLGLFLEIQDSLKLATVLTALRAFSDQSAPGLTVWETLKHNDVPYVKIRSASPNGVRPQPGSNWAIYYAATPGALIISLKEGVLLAALDRLKTRGSALKEGKEFVLGSSAVLEVKSKLFEVASTLLGESYGETIRTECFNNLPILNEWRRLFPSVDPIETHERVFKAKLICPAGGTYQWNSQWMTMESSVLGHPGAPTEIKIASPMLADLKRGIFSLKFEHDGLRAKALLENNAVSKP